jgi:hypothetical protein
VAAVAAEIAGRTAVVAATEEEAIAAGKEFLV